MEIADLILINKADGDLLPAATRTCADYAGALRLLRKRRGDPEGFPKAMLVSAVTGDGLGTAWEQMQTLENWRKANGFWADRRAEQAHHWFEEEVKLRLLAQLEVANMKGKMEKLGKAVAAGEITAAAAARQALEGL